MATRDRFAADYLHRHQVCESTISLDGPALGGGIHLSRADEALHAFAEEQSIPVAHTLSGKGAIACTHALSAGLFSRYSRIANDLIEGSDCLIVVGSKLRLGSSCRSLETLVLISG